MFVPYSSVIFKKNVQRGTMKHTFLSIVAVLSFAITAKASLTSSNGCYQIGTADDLYEFAELFNTYYADSLPPRLDCAKLTQDIVVNENVLKADGTPNEGPFRPWESIRSFEGTFDGQNHTISGLYQVDNEYNLGLFSFFNGSIKNLGIVDAYFYMPEVEDKDSYRILDVGALTAFAGDSVVVDNCFSSATVKSDSKGGNGVAGLVGYASGGVKIKDSHNDGLVVSTEESGGAGGLVGYAGSLSTITLTNSYNTGSVRGNRYVGGLIGYAVQERTRTEERFNKSVNYGSAKFLVERCYNSGIVHGGEGYSGGLVGRGQGTIKESYNIGTVEGVRAAGGLIGVTSLDEGIGDTLRIESSYNRGTVERIVPESLPDSLLDLFYSYVGYVIGGFVGKAENVTTLVANSYNAADIVHDGKVENLLVGEVKDGVFKLENSVNRKVSNGTSYVGVFDVEDSLFYNGVVATCLHEGSDVWGQKSFGNDKYPDFSGTVNVSIGVHSITWHTFDGDSAVYPSKYTEGLGLVLPGDVSREGYLFAGWYAVANPTATDPKIEKIGTTETGAKNLYAQWLQIKVPKSDGTCYQISSVQDLYSFASIVNGINGMKLNPSACGKLTQDIVVNEQVLNAKGKLNGAKTFKKWIPMREFNGTFDGDGHTIYGLYYNDKDDEDGVGFIATIYYGEWDAKKIEIKNLGLEDFYFRGGSNVGAFVGITDAYKEGNSVAITNSHSEGLLEGYENVGGFIGFARINTSISNSFNMSAVDADQEAGGFIGLASSDAEILNSYNMGSVYADDKAGGFIGNVREVSADIVNSYNSGAISGTSNIGGLVGYIYHYETLTILRSYNAGEVNGSTNVGGLVGTGYGYPNIVFINSYNKGRVIGYSKVAGLLGWMKSVAGSVDVFNSYNAGEIVSDGLSDGKDIASLVGYAEGGHYSFDNGFYLNQPNINAFNLYKPEDESNLFNPVVDMDNFVAVSKDQLMGGAVADSLRGWYEKDGEKPKENGEDGFAWAEDPPGTKILPHLNLENTKHRVILVLGEDGKIAKGHDVTYYEEGVPVNLPESQYVSRDGYFFTGWYEDRDCYSSGCSGTPKTAVDVSNTKNQVFYAGWKIDSTLISSSSEIASSSSVESSSSAKSSSSVSSSSSARSSSSSLKISSSSVKSSSSSAKSSSSSAKTSSSSSSKGKSSSSKTNRIDVAPAPQFSVTVLGNTLQVAGARVGAKYALFDMQGNKVRHGTVQGANFSVGVPVTGRFVLQIGSALRPVTVKY